MASQFYNRYIPPSPKQAPAQLPAGTEKRKREPIEESKEHETPEEAISLRKDGKAKHLDSPKREKKKKSKSLTHENPLDDPPEEGGLSATKHSKIRSKFEKSGEIAKLVKRSKDESKRDAEKESSEASVTELHGLEPIPQPEIEEDVETTPIPVLPDWIANPIKSTHSETVAFNDLSLSTATKNTLAAKGYKEAFAIQSAVLPLLLPGSKHYRGDICIASGTGTGKTLAFVLPMIEALRDKPVRRLRGLIVVPTRELVSQTRSVLESCGSGSGLNVASSEGSKTLAEERRILIERVPRFDPREAERQSAMPIDYLTLGDSDEDDYGDDINEELSILPNYVVDYRSKIDVLVCTPGRLVDHLKTTKGFTLEHIEWFVIDEVDRLLNQSYHEWIDHVIPALEQKRPMGPAQHNLMKRLFHHEQRRVRKIIASATLTTDISKLVPLRLYRPKLVTLEGAMNGPFSKGEPGSDKPGDFVLPETLTEMAMPVKEVADKPLYLLQILDEAATSPETVPAKTIVKDADNDADMADGPDDSDLSSDGSVLESDISSSMSDTSEGSSSVVSSSTSDNSSDNSSSKIVSHEHSSSRSNPRGPKTETGVIVFTTTNEGALRLTRLLKLMRPGWGSKVGCIVGTNTTASRRKILSRLRRGDLIVAVTSNLAARGLNIGNLAQVVNYDVPTSLESYVHRVGRTARAGNKGVATTLLAHHEGHWFWNEIARSGRVERRSKVTRASPKEFSTEDRKTYEVALTQLGDEARGKV